MDKNSFDTIAFCYDALAKLWFGKAIEESQVVFLDQIPVNAKILIIGGGTGKILEEICRLNKNVYIDYMEYSAKMLEKAKCRKVQNCNIRFMHGDEKMVSEENYYDVVITYFFLDLFELARLESVIKKLHRSLNKNGFWLIADFYLDKHSSFAQRSTIWLMYRFFRVFSNIEALRLIVPDGILLRQGLSMTSERLFYKGLIRSLVWQSQLMAL